jgi:error-prone DNA polymerase
MVQLMAYAEVFAQSNFSFLYGASHPEELVTTAAFLGYRAIAITDECSVAGLVRAYTEIKNSHLPIKLISGSYFQLNDDFKFVLLCPTKKAYTELCRIITHARKRAIKGEYHLAEWDIKTIKQCLLIWLPSFTSTIDTEWARWLTRYFHGRCWIGCQRLLDGQDNHRFTACQTLADDFKIPITACTGVLFHHSDRQSLQHVLEAIRLGTKVEELGLQALSNKERTLRSLAKLNKLYPEAWRQESVYIAQLCNFSLAELSYQYPAELVPQGQTATQYLRQCVEEGIKRRFPNGVSDDIRATIEKELRLIESEGYAYFFLTIYDIVQFAQAKHILYQGRGSAANSIVCYCLEITAVDPRQINVLFERFISKERNEPPDIDVDFEHQRREEIIQYIYKKYGRERTAIAASVITYRFKSAFRDVAKALGISEGKIQHCISQINLRDKAMGWQQQLLNSGLNISSLKVKQLIYLINQILGFPRHLSQHVGGFVISAGPLYELVPIENAAMPERTVIQWDKDDLESLGLLKVDILALGMLTAIRKAFCLIQDGFNYQLSIPFITRLGDDPQVYKMITQADTIGVFQIESRAQMSMLPRLKPKTYYDLVVQIAIVRPGPIQGDMVHPYLKRRHGKEAVTYPSSQVKNVLERTMGVPIFQEQVIQLAMVAAGFSGGEADQLRRAMASWKKNGKLRQFKDKLITGMLERGYEEDFALQIYEQICGFGEYGFPESHSASFAVLAYTSAWLKYYYPREFYTALLNSLPMGFYSASQLVQDAQRHQVIVKPVCINASNYHHKIETTSRAIRLGFRQINGLSYKAALIIEQQRPELGYRDIGQLKQLAITQKDLAALASANALVSLTGNRFNTRWQLMDSQVSLPLFSHYSEESRELAAPNECEALIEDMQALSLSLDQHPISLLLKNGQLQSIIAAKDLIQKEDKSLVKVAGCVVGRQAPGTAGGITFITLEDHTGNINIVVWQATARSQKQAFLKSTLLEVHGVLERSSDDVIHVIAGKLIDHSHQIPLLTLLSRDFH